MSLGTCKDGDASSEQTHSLPTSAGPLRADAPTRSEEQTIDSRAGLKELNVICWGLLAALGLIVGMLDWNHIKGGEGFDFVYFYGAGQLATEHPPLRLYDYSSQVQVFNSICPSQKIHYGPSPYPPFVGLFFAGFSHLPFRVAYFLWMAVSLALYIAGVRAVLRDVLPTDRVQRSLLLCLALAFPPFLLYNLVNGQLASLAVFCIGLTIYEEGRQRPLSAGLFLSLLAYKPTLLVLIIPMLCLTRRFRALVGFLIGTTTLGAISTLIAGPQVWPAYARLIDAFRKLSAGDASSGIKGGLRHWQFVDLNALTYSIPGTRSPFGLAVVAVVVLSLATWVAVLFWKSVKGDRSAQHLTWALALTWTLLINIYVPVYDSVLAVLAIILTIGALENLRWHDAVRRGALFALLIFAASWITRAIAEAHGLQLLTMLLFALGVAQASLLQRSLKCLSTKEGSGLRLQAAVENQGS